MASSVSLTTILLLMIVIQSEIKCEDSVQSNVGLDNTASIPVLPSGKRQHNIMRFGKRPAGGHSLIHFGKRDDDVIMPPKTPSHSFLYFGKRSESDGRLPDLLQYLQKNNRDNSYKRGHTIMRFGKRGGENHQFIRFGKRDDSDFEYDDGYYYPGDYDGSEDGQKRDGHSMMYFGKRGDGHSMLYFGKRTGHNMLSFGKRESDDQGKRAAHAMIHFGKRGDDDFGDDLGEDKRAHAMIHFGKRDQDEYDNEDKRGGSHQMIHFGKRDPNMEDVTPLFWYPEPSEKRQHNLLRFGKKTDGYRKGSHSMIHFGKREDPMNMKKAHAMIHFGKRSVDQSVDPASNTPTNQSEEPPTGDSTKTLNRVKRDIDSASDSLMTLMKQRVPEEEDDEGQNAYPVKDAYYPPEDIFSPFEVPEEEDLNSGYSEYRYPVKKDASKNVFLRFG